MLKKHQQSLSEIVQNALENLMKKEETLPESVIDSLTGSLPVPEDFNYSKALDDYYKQKYSL